MNLDQLINVVTDNTFILLGKCLHGLEEWFFIIHYTVPMKKKKNYDEFTSFKKSILSDKFNTFESY